MHEVLEFTRFCEEDMFVSRNGLNARESSERGVDSIQGQAPPYRTQTAERGAENRSSMILSTAAEIAAPTVAIEMTKEPKTRGKKRTATSGHPDGLRGSMPQANRAWRQ